MSAWWPVNPDVETGNGGAVCVCVFFWEAGWCRKKQNKKKTRPAFGSVWVDSNAEGEPVRERREKKLYHMFDGYFFAYITIFKMPCMCREMEGWSPPHFQMLGWFWTLCYSKLYADGGPGLTHHLTAGCGKHLFYIFVFVLPGSGNLPVFCDKYLLFSLWVTEFAEQIVHFNLNFYSLVGKFGIYEEVGIKSSVLLNDIFICWLAIAVIAS